MEFLIGAAAFIFGSIIGSFLNVVILRYNTGRDLGGRSKCPNCAHRLSWFELVPIFSWIFLKGKCKNCKSKISPQYPLVEIGTAVLFSGLAIWAFNFLPDFQTMAVFLIWHFIIFSILIVIFVYDLRHKIIPDSLSYTFAIMALIQTLIVNTALYQSNLTSNLEITLNVFAGLIFAFPFAFLWFISRGKWIGLGDAKLALGFGWLLGFVNGLNALFISFWIGAVVGLFLVAMDQLLNRGQSYKMKSEIPFGPFMIVALIFQFFLLQDWIGVNILINGF